MQHSWHLSRHLGGPGYLIPAGTRLAEEPGARTLDGPDRSLLTAMRVAEGPHFGRAVVVAMPDDVDPR